MDAIISALVPELVQGGPQGVLLLLLWWELRKLSSSVTRVLDRQDEVLALVRPARD